MKLFTGMGPNPRVVRIFMAEKSIELPLEQVDLVAGENRQEAHLARNPAGQLPTLQLDDGSYRLYKGYRVQHNNILGPYKGGIRFHRDVSLDHI